MKHRAGLRIIAYAGSRGVENRYDFIDAVKEPVTDSVASKEIKDVY